MVEKKHIPNYLWTALGISLLVFVVVVVILALRGPAIGNVFSNVIMGGFDSNSVAQSSAAAMKDVEKKLASTNSQLSQTRLIIREGNLNMIVEDTRSTREAIISIVADLADEGAFVVSSSERDGTGDQDPTIHMSIRVPVEQFDETMNRLAAMAVTIRQRNETAQDVTEEYVDLQGRLKAMEIARDRLLDIMENSENTEDLLEAEQQLTKREVDIEGIKGRMQYLSGAASLSRIKIDLSPHILSQPIDSSWRPAEEARRSLDILVNSFQNFISGLIRFGISGLPWLVFYGWIVYAVYRFVKKRGLLVFDDPKETPSKKE